MRRFRPTGRYRDSSSLRRMRAVLLASSLVVIAQGGAEAQSLEDERTSNDDAFAPLEQEGAFNAATDPVLAVPPSETLAQPAPEAARLGERLNLRMNPVDGPRRTLRRTPEEGDGIRLGRFILRPTLTQRIVGERESGGGGSDERIFSETEGAFDLISDWSRHELAIRGSAIAQKNISGDGPTDPSADIDAALRLDLSGDTTATLRGGYSFFREDDSDPNALLDAIDQADVQEFTAGIGVEREAGLIRGSLDLDGARTLYGDATLTDGSTVSLDDRDQSSVTLTSRLAYVNGGVLTPFVEGDVTRTRYDETIDSGGFERSSWTYGLRSGLEIDLGEKWSGEIAAGYAWRDIDDLRLDSIDAFTLDGLVNWSPRRGTDVALALATDIESSTTPGLPGSVAYTVSATVDQQVRHDLVASLGGGVRLRQFEGTGYEDEVIYNAEVGLSWSLNRYLDIVADAGYERTTREGGDDYDTARVGLGVSVKR